MINTYLNYLNAKSFNLFLTLWQSCEVQWLYVSVCCKVNVNLALGENSKEPSSSATLTEASFDDVCNEKKS